MGNQTSGEAAVKTKKTPRSLGQYTLGEEVFNSVTHGVGALLAIIGGSVVVTLAAVFGDALDVFACTVYAVTLVLMYSMSTLYHAFPFPRVKKVFRVFDHSSVFLLIAGTYTPFMLMGLRGQTMGFIICVGVWAVSVLGIVLNAIDLKRFAKLSLVLYIVMGWCVVFAIGNVVAVLPTTGLVLLIAGGVSYTAGVAFYVVKKIRYMHSIWHLFVLLGSTLHYLCITLYVLPGSITA